MRRITANLLTLGAAVTTLLFPPAGAALAVARPPVPVIIDTDVGDDIDDAFAIALAVSDPQLEVLGVTTAWGDTRARTLLVRRLLAAMGRADVAVAQGPATPDSTPFTQRRWAEGASDQSPAPDAIAFIAAQAAGRPGQITLVALAPLSNVQAVLARHPAAFRMLKQVVLMGGSIRIGYPRPGTRARPPSAEYNVASAPEAFAALLRSGVPVTLFPLDSSEIPLEEAARARLFAHGSGATDALALLYHQWRYRNGWSQITPTLFDVVPVAWMIDPSVCAPTRMAVTVDARGFTRPGGGAPNVAACLKSSGEAVARLTLDDLAPEPGKTP
jgi:inosine-uridine nucleoside N-ribohydrolase